MAEVKEAPEKPKSIGLENLVKGFKVGVGGVADVVGSTINTLEYWALGIGTADKRAIPTISKKIISDSYSNIDEKQPFWRGYVSRYLGTAAGVAGTGGALYGAFLLNPIVGLAVPGLLGAYGVLQGAAKYAHDFLFGEDGKKASFEDGLKFGWERGTHVNILPPLEGICTGRGYSNSMYQNGITESAKKVKRNLLSVTGSVIGEIGGKTASILTLGLLPAIKSFSAMYKQAFA
jgi:hypothetical protein